MNSLSQLPLLLIGLAGCLNGMATWRDKNRLLNDRVTGAVKASMRAADLSRDRAARELEMDASQFSRMVENGGNVTAFVVLGERVPVFGAALKHRLQDLWPSEEDELARRERLLQAIHALPQKEARKCDEVRPEADCFSASSSRR